MQVPHHHSSSAPREQRACLEPAAPIANAFYGYHPAHGSEADQLYGFDWKDVDVKPAPPFAGPKALKALKPAMPSTGPGLWLLPVLICLIVMGVMRHSG